MELRDVRTAPPEFRRAAARISLLLVAEALRSVHTDMVLRTVYARDFKLMWKMLGPATKHDVPMWLVLSRAFGQILKNRLARTNRPG